MNYELIGCFRRSMQQMDLQDQMDLARWQGEGGAPLPCARGPTANASRRPHTKAAQNTRADVDARELLVTA